MDLEELRSVRDAERRKSGLQSLRESFYEDARDYVATLRERRDRAADRADDPFSDPEVRRLSDEIETAEEVIEAIYERRMGKLLERAGLAAREMGADEEGLTAEERALFSDLVDRIRANERRVLDGEDAPADAGSDSTDPGGTDGTAGTEGDGSRVVGTADPAGGGGPGMTGTERRDQTEVSAADAMGGGHDATGTADAGGVGAGDQTGGRNDPADRPPVETGDDRPPGGSAAGDPPADGAPPDGSPADRSVEPVDPGGPAVPNPDRDPEDPPERRPDGSGVAESPPDGRPGAVAGPDATGPSGADPGAESGSASDADTGPDTDAGGDDPDRVLVRITSDVGRILGVDDREYDLAADDVVTLPERNAAPLLERDAAERLD